MYDDQTRSRWSQLVGKATEGPLAGSRLKKLPSVITTWGKWRSQHPDTTVYVKPSTPYRVRFTGESFSEIAQGGDGPVENKDLVVGLEGHVEARAYLVRYLAGKRLINDLLEGAPIVVYLHDDLATARIFDRALDGRTLTFRLDQGRLTDQETGSVWDGLGGKAVEGPLRGRELRPHISTHSLWFAWKKYRPDTVLIDSD